MARRTKKTEEEVATSDELARQRDKHVAVANAKFKLRQRLEAIDHRVDVIVPLRRGINSAAAQGELPGDIEVGE